MELNNLYESVKNVVKDVLEYEHGIDIYQVTLVNPTNYTVSVKQLNGYKSYNNVNIIGQGLGHGKGCLQLPEINDLVIVVFIKDSENPLIIGSIFNKYMSNRDAIIQINKNEWFINNRVNGGYILIDKNDNITLKNNNGYFRLLADGRVKMNDFTFPKNDGSSGQVLKTNGNGDLYWANDNVSS